MLMIGLCVGDSIEVGYSRNQARKDSRLQDLEKSWMSAGYSGTSDANRIMIFVLRQVWNPFHVVVFIGPYIETDVSVVINFKVWTNRGTLTWWFITLKRLHLWKKIFRRIGIVILTKIYNKGSSWLSNITNGRPTLF